MAPSNLAQKSAWFSIIHGCSAYGTLSNWDSLVWYTRGGARSLATFFGVCHLAGRAWDQLCADPQGALGQFPRAGACLCASSCPFAGLLHDVGHAAFSHTAEHYLPPVDAFSLPDDWYRDGMIPGQRQAHHEDCTLAVVHALAQDGTLEEYLARDICAVLQPSVRRSQSPASMG